MRYVLFVVTPIILFVCTGASGAVRDERVRSQILNFETDFVRGRALSPAFLLQLGQAPKDLDTIVYLRRDFNDFHRVDRKTRPKFYSP